MTILNGVDGGDDAEIQVESDTIVMATLLGFLVARVALRQPVTISFEHPGDFHEWLAKREALGKALDKLRAVLKAGGHDPGLTGLQLSTTPLYDADNSSGRSVAITGMSGGALEPFVLRGREFSSERMASYVKGILRGLKDRQELGAYYGVVDDPVGQESANFMASSVRRLIEYNGDEGPRWKSGAAFHGLIGANGGNRPADSKPQAGSFEPAHLIQSWSGQGKVVGYCHGMSWAIMMAKVMGPWATPFEVAIGEKTTKLASCFGCTTFMYATGFVPSAIHLGSAESWVPLPPDGGGAQYEGWSHVDRMASALNELWARDVSQYLKIGARLMRTSTLVKAPAKEAAKKLDSLVLRRTNSDERAAANLFLDALTRHKNDLKRLTDVFE